MANPLNSLDWGNWIYGLLWGSIGGGANAVSGAMAASMVDSKDFAFGSAQSLKLMGAIFLFTFVKDAALYLKQNPLPAIKTVTTVETVERKQHPPAVVTTTVEKTEISNSSSTTPDQEKS